MKRKLWKALAITSGVVLGLALLLVAVVQVKGVPTYTQAKAPYAIPATFTPEQVSWGRKLVAMRCQDCHVNGQGTALTGRLMPEFPSEMGTIYSANITQHKEQGIGSWTNEQLYVFLRTGVRPDGRHAVIMPIVPNMADEDLLAIIAFLRSNDPIVQAQDVPSQPTEYSLLFKGLAHGPLAARDLNAKLPLQRPAKTDTVAYGRYLVTGMHDCFACHSPDLTNINLFEPEKTPGYLMGGQPFPMPGGNSPAPPKINGEADGIRQWTQDQFITAVKYGKTKRGTALSLPMRPFVEMDSTDIIAMYRYLLTVPAPLAE